MKSNRDLGLELSYIAANLVGLGLTKPGFVVKQAALRLSAIGKAEEVGNTETSRRLGNSSGQKKLPEKKKEKF